MDTFHIQKILNDMSTFFWIPKLFWIRLDTVGYVSTSFWIRLDTESIFFGYGLIVGYGQIQLDTVGYSWIRLDTFGYGNFF